METPPLSLLEPTPPAALAARLLEAAARAASGEDRSSRAPVSNDSTPGPYSGGYAQDASDCPTWPRLQLFLDYDGTLADFAPTPDDVLPDPALIELLTRLARSPHLKIAVISGRRLEHIQTLLPVPELLLAGTYGLELRLPGKAPSYVAELNSIRPALDELKPRWQALIAGRTGFYLEDKGWSLAIHARFASDQDAEQVITAAQACLPLTGAAHLHLIPGHKFLEFSPRIADKGLTLAALLDQHPWPGALPVFMGDDDKDERAFTVVRQRGGIAIVVSAMPRPSAAHFRLENPPQVRQLLEALFASFQP